MDYESNIKPLIGIVEVARIGQRLARACVGRWKGDGGEAVDHMENWMFRVELSHSAMGGAGSDTLVGDGSVNGSYAMASTTRNTSRPSDLTLKHETWTS